MCLIIHREHGSNVPNDVLTTNRTKNPDGFGISWRDEYGLHYEKFSPKDYEPFHALLKKIDRDPNIEYTAHYRFATTGAPCRDLSHPFVYDDPDPKVGEVHVFHNGVIPIRADKGESDTSQFVKAVLAKLPSRWWDDNALTFLVEQAIGYSRLLIMTKDETVRLDGSSQWRKEGGIWYSTEPLPYRHAKAPKYNPKMYSSKKDDAKRPYSWTPKVIETRTDDDRFADMEPDETDEPVGWYHEGHWVEAVDNFDEDGDDRAGPCICSECSTAGEYYVIGGTTFIDIKHDVEYADEDEDALSLSDKETMREVYAN